MREMLQKKPVHTGIIAGIVTLICMLQSFFRPLYVDVDNYFISLTANKMFAGEMQDGYILHLHPLLCKVLEGVLLLVESADCVMLVSVIMLLIAIWSIAYVIANNVKSYYELIVYLVAFLAVVFVKDLFHDNYTRWAAFMTAAGVMMLLWDVHCECYDRKHQGLIVFLLVSGMMWRDEAFLVFLPFVCLKLFMVVYKTTKAERGRILREMGRIVFIPVVCIIFFAIIDGAVRHSEKYVEAIAYDSARVKVVDYAMKEWNEMDSLPEGVSKNDYESAIKWTLFDTERIDAEYFLRMSEVGAKKEFEGSLQGLVGMQKRMLSVFLDSQHFHYLGILLILLFLLGMYRRNYIYDKIQMILLFVGTDLIFLFFAYVGRAIERGYMPALYALLSVLAISLLTEERQVGSNRILASLIIVLSILAFGREVVSGNWLVGQSAFNAKTDTENVYEIWCRDDKIFIWNSSNYILGPVRVFSEQGKLIPREVLSHHLIAGSWICGQVYFEQYLESMDVENPMTALLERENTLYVATDPEPVLTYLQENVDENTVVEFAGEIYGNLVWRFYAVE